LFSSELPFSARIEESEMEAAAEAYLNAKLSDGLLDLYPSAAYPRPFDALVAAFGDAYLACPCHRAARAASKHAPTFFYRFDYDDLIGSGRVGASHGLDLPFIFDGFDRSPAKWLYPAVMARRAKPLSETMMSYFSAFAETGDPNRPGLPAWCKAEPEGGLRLILDLPITTSPPDLDAKCAWWAKQPIVVH
jgi:para-nitrobenzyl esterase